MFAEVLALDEKLLIAGIKAAVHDDSAFRGFRIEFQHRHRVALIRDIYQFHNRALAAEKIRIVSEEKLPRLFPRGKPVSVLPVGIEFRHTVQRGGIFYMPVFKFLIGSRFKHIIKIRRALYCRTYLLCNRKVAAVHVHQSVELKAYPSVGV